jgi:acylphosphatase
MRRIEVVIVGRVQGVSYRATCADEAIRLGLSGWVRNRDDGAVELVAEGDVAALEQLVGWCEHGPDLASVDDVQVVWKDPRGEPPGFRIRR